MNEGGAPAAGVLAELDRRRATEPEVHGGRLFGLTYPSGRTDLEGLAHAVSERYLFGNALNPFKFPELAALEREVVAMVGSLVHLPQGDLPQGDLPLGDRPQGDRPQGDGRDGGGGSMTSGGTESILMSMLVSRERARARGIERPQILAPFSAHPAYAKAAHYFDLDLVSIPLDDAYRADLGAAERLIGPRTAVVVASAFSYPHGVMDPVTDLAALAAANGAGCHVDACIGGFVLPFLERLGREVPPWDFRVAGVTEMSADVHKYGYVPKGASVVLHRDNDWFGHQAFLYDRWPAGLYGSPAIAGARPAAPIATAWAVMTYLGSAGYDAIVRDLMATVDKVRAGIAAIGGIEVVGDPIGPVIAFRSDTIDLAAVGDVLDERGWNLNRINDPPGLHLMLSPAHAAVADQLLADVAEAVADHGASKGIEARYS